MYANRKLSPPKRELIVGRVLGQVGQRRAIGIHDLCPPVAVAVGLEADLRAEGGQVEPVLVSGWNSKFIACCGLEQSRN